MPAELAAAYLSMDEASFRKVANAGKVYPVELELDMERWRRKDLDALLRRLPLRNPEPVRPQVVAPLLDDAALERIVSKIQGKLSAPTRVAYGLKEASEVLGLGRSTIWKLVQAGKLTSVRVGGRTLIRREEIERLLEGDVSDGN